MVNLHCVKFIQFAFLVSFTNWNIILHENVKILRTREAQQHKSEREKIVVVWCVCHYYIQLHSIFILSSFIIKEYIRSLFVFFLSHSFKLENNIFVGFSIGKFNHVLVLNVDIYNILLSCHLFPYVAMQRKLQKSSCVFFNAIVCFCDLLWYMEVID